MISLSEIASSRDPRPRFNRGSRGGTRKDIRVNHLGFGLDLAFELCHLSLFGIRSLPLELGIGDSLMHHLVMLGVAEQCSFGYLTVCLFLCYVIITVVKYILPVEIQPLEQGGYLARSPALPGFLVQADTVEEVINLVPGVAQALIESMREKGIPLPRTLQEVEPPFHTDLLVPV